MKNKKNLFQNFKVKKIFLFLIFTLFVTSGFQCTTGTKVVNSPVKLIVWGVYEEKDNLQPLFDKFKKEHPTVTIEYKKFTPQEYENQLLEAWANDQGPDIYFLPSSSLIKYKNKDRITPMPSSVKLPYREVKTSGVGSFKKETTSDYTKDVAVASINDLELKFPDVVKKDVYIDGKIYGLPLSLETLAMFYNRDLLNKANIPNPPKVWSDDKTSDDFIDQVKKITRVTKDGNFIQSGTALGTTNNVANASDIIALLLMQSNIDLGEKTGRVNLSGNIKSTLSTINFYNDFSNSIKDVYSWNKDQSNSLEAFQNGQVAFFFGYPYQRDQIKNLNYGITQVPQLQYGISNGEVVPINPVNIANYWVMTVSHKSKNSDIAWGFIDFATKKDNVKLYLDKSKKPSALKDMISEQSKDLKIAPFVNQILSARSWYHGANPDLANRYLEELVDQVKNATTNNNLSDIINSYQSKINQTIK